jgi:hypothetical protein
MSTRKLNLASRALQIYLDHSLASAGAVVKRINASMEFSLGRFDCLMPEREYMFQQATKDWIEFLQKAQSS